MNNVIDAYNTVCRLANSLGDATVPTEDVIDLAQAVKCLFERVFSYAELGVSTPMRCVESKCGAAFPCQHEDCGLGPNNTVHTNKDRYGYHEYKRL